MDNKLQEIIFNEFSNRYDRDIFYIIKGFFKGEDAKDVFQDLKLHFFKAIEKFYETNPNLFSTRAWVKTSSENFCKSVLRKRNGKRSVKIIFDDLALANSRNFDDSDLKSEIDKDLNDAVKDFLKNLSKRDALILKMKYYYGKPSNYISQKLNEAHINVYIQRIKERLIRRTGIEDVGSFVNRYNTYL